MVFESGWGYLRMKKHQTLRKQHIYIQKSWGWVGALLVNMEDAYNTTWKSSVFIMTAQEVGVSRSQEKISVGEQSQVALMQKAETVIASVCLYCWYQHTDQRKALPLSGSLSHWGPWHGSIHVINTCTPRTSSVPTQAAPHRRESMDALELYK